MSNFNEEKGVLTITLPEKVTANNAEEIRDEVKDLEETYCPKMVEVDMKGVDYISSAGLRILLVFVKKYGPIRVFNVSAEIKEIFQVSGFARLVTIE